MKLIKDEIRRQTANTALLCRMRIKEERNEKNNISFEFLSSRCLFELCIRANTKKTKN